jgi:hypothetical protein
MKNKERFVNNNKNIVYVTVQAPKQQRAYIHKSKESNNETSRPSFSVPFTNTSNLESQILREQLNNIESDRNPSINRIGTKINDKFRTPIYADNTFIKNGTNKEEVDVSSEADLYKDYNMSIPYENPASVFADKKVEAVKINKPKPLSKMNKTQLQDEYRNLTGLAPVNMSKDQIIKAIKEYKFSSPNKR